MQIPKTTQFHEHLISLGVPVIAINKGGVDAEIRLAETATQEHRDLAAAEAVAYDWSPTPPPPEWFKERVKEQEKMGIPTQLDAIYHLGKNWDHYVKNGIKPDINAKEGTPEWWIAAQDKIREDNPKPEE